MSGPVSDIAQPAPAPAAPGRANLPARFLDSDVFASFRRSKLTVAAALVTLLFFVLALTAGLFASQDPFDPAELQLMNSRLPPLWEAEGQRPFLLGTDEQGRDILRAHESDRLLSRPTMVEAARSAVELAGR